MWFWILGLAVLSLVAPFSGFSSLSTWAEMPPIMFAGFLQALLPFLPAIIGGAASLIKGKKTKFASQQTPEQLALTQFLTNLAKQNLSQSAANKRPTYDAMNMISNIFGMGGGNYGMPQNTATPAPGSPDAMKQRWNRQWGNP